MSPRPKLHRQKEMAITSIPFMTPFLASSFAVLQIFVEAISQTGDKLGGNKQH